MTTKPSLFWVDPGDIADLIGRLGAPPSGPGDPPRKASAPASRVPPPGAAAALAPVASTASTASFPRTPPSPALAPLELPAGPLEDRLLALLDWIRASVTFDHGFVVDEEGLALVHEAAPLELIAASAVLSESWESLRNRFDLAPRNVMSVGLPDSQELYLVTASTHWGRLSLGLVLREAVPKGQLATIHEQFQRTLEEKEHIEP